MHAVVIPIVFALVLIAELPDKSMFASLVLGTRLSPRWVFLGVAAAFLVHVVIAVVAGGLLSLLPHTVVQIVVAVLFAAGSAYLWWSARHPEQEAEHGADDAASARHPTSRLGVFGTSFLVVFLGEWGDITQILTANLTARYNAPIQVGIGAVLGLWAAAALAIVAGRTLLRVISMTLLQRIGALILLGFAVYSIVGLATS